MDTTSEPSYEEVPVIDLDVTSTNGTCYPMTLMPEQTLEETPDHLIVRGLMETVVFERRNIVWYSRRARMMKRNLGTVKH